MMQEALQYLLTPPSDRLSSLDLTAGYGARALAWRASLHGQAADRATHDAPTVIQSVRAHR